MSLPPIRTLSPKSDVSGTALGIQRQDDNPGSQPSLIPIFILVGVAFGLAAFGRYFLMESDRFAAQCAEGAGGVWCLPWKWLPQVFLFNRLGIACLAIGIAAFVSRLRWLAWAGLFLGVSGLVLYCFDYSAVGGLLSLLTLASYRAGPFGQQQSE